MKLTIGHKFASKPLKAKKVGQESSSLFFGKKPSWMITDQEQKQEAIAATSINRPPEIWIPEGETRLLRIRDPKEVCCIFTYNLRLGPKEFRRVTVPSEDDTDLLRDDLGLTPAFTVIYEVIDRKGYVDKKTGKKVREIPRFWVVGKRLYEQIEFIRKRIGPLCNYDIEVSRQGSGQNTTYAILHQSSVPLPPDVKAKPRLAKDIEKFYAPPSEAEQRMLVRRMQRVQSADVD
jgi:hypothetical protein